MSRTICEMALREKVAVLSTDAMRDERFSSRESVILQGLRSVMSAPMIFQNRPLGIISVDNRDLSSAFSKQDLETLTIIANLAATAIHNAQMVRDHVRMEVTRQNFARFLPPALVRQVTEQGRELRLGGQKAEVTVLFTDIRAFTSMCASRPAEEIVNLLNVYFHELTECVFRHQGTLDKYLGDGILAVFGCPEPHADHSARAARAAVEMRDILTTHDLLRRQIGVGIALHRGEVIHGFVGSRQRIQYTVVGDTVNTASRLCGQAKAGQILISRAVLDTAGEYLETRPLAPVALEGKTEPLPCYEIVGLSDKGKAFRADVTPWRGETERHPTN
jgi:adenylate cyclase